MHNQENAMERTDLATLSCVNVECQLFGRPKQDYLVIRKRYGKDRLRLLRCRSFTIGQIV